jgi:hypothetical protein
VLSPSSRYKSVVLLCQCRSEFTAWNDKVNGEQAIAKLLEPTACDPFEVSRNFPEGTEENHE